MKITDGRWLLSDKSRWRQTNCRLLSLILVYIFNENCSRFTVETYFNFNKSYQAITLSPQIPTLNQLIPRSIPDVGEVKIIEKSDDADGGKLSFAIAAIQELALLIVI